MLEQREGNIWDGCGAGVTGQPEEQLLDPCPALTQRAYEKLVRQLRDHGNTLSEPHKAALRTMLRGFTQQALEATKLRQPYPLPTGMGKTTGIECWLAALAELGLACRVAVAVCSQKVEALCSIKRNLLAHGVPEHLIGLAHAYPYDPSKLARSSPDPKTASLPSDPDARDRPILLATHARARSAPVKRSLRHGTKNRDLIFWDEALVVSEAVFFTLDELIRLERLLAPDLPGSTTVSLLSQAAERLQREINRQAGGEAPSLLELTDINFEQAGIELDGLLGEVFEPWARSAIDRLRSFVAISHMQLRALLIRQDRALVTYVVTIPAELDSVAILDASFPIRKLCHLDASLRPAVDMGPDLKRWDNVIINAYRAASGRRAVEDSLAGNNGKGRGYAAFVADILKQMPPEEAAIIFTFLGRDGHRGSLVDSFKRALRAAGLDPEQLTADGRPRFVFLTWGQETSISDFAYCTHVIFAGVLNRKRVEVGAAVLAQARDLCMTLDGKTVDDHLVAETTHAIYQAISRANCRRVDSQYARRTHVWLPIPTAAARTLLEIVMPGVKWHDATSSAVGRTTTAGTLAEFVRNYLEALPPTADKVSTSLIKASVPGFSTASAGTSTKALKRGAALAGWSHRARSLERGAASCPHGESLARVRSRK